MIIHNLHLVWAILTPHKAHAPLVIDPNAVLPLPVPMQGFQAIAWQPGQVCQAGSTVQDLQASLSLSLHSLEAAYSLAIVEGFGVLITKALDHGRRIAECDVSRKGLLDARHEGVVRE
jgi:hypothetical protein